MQGFIYSSVAALIAGIGVFLYQRRPRLKIQLETGLVPDIVGHDVTPKHKQVRAKITNVGYHDCYLLKINMRFKKGHDEILVTDTGYHLPRNTKMASGEIRYIGFSPERLDITLAGKNYPVFRCEVITSTDKRFISKYAEYLFDHRLPD